MDGINTWYLPSIVKCAEKKPEKTWGHHGRDRMVVGFTTTYAISAYYH